jgi:excisionase family DNA binding protein
MPMDINVTPRGSTVSPDMRQEWFDPGEAAEYLRVTRSTIYRWTREGRIRVHKLPTGGGSRYRREDLDALLLGEGEDRTAK